MTKQLPVYGIVEFSHKKEEDYFYANELRAHLESHQFVNAPHKHSTYITVLFTKGSGEHQIDFDTYTIKKGSVFLLSPGQVHCWKLSKNVQGYIFFHTKEFYDNIFLKKKIDSYPFFYLHQNYPAIYLSIEETKKMNVLFSELYQEHKRTQVLKDSKLEILVDLIYIELTRQYRNKEENITQNNSRYNKVKLLQKLVDENFRQTKFPSQYADLMNMSARNLNRICKEVLNKSIGDIINERILTEAKRLLVQKNITVLMIANELGFDDYSYFVRMFKKNTGLSPKEFQNKTKSPFTN